MSFRVSFCPTNTFSLAGNVFGSTPSQGTNAEKSLLVKNQTGNPNHGGKQTPFTFILSLTGRVLSNFRQKKDGVDPSETDIKVLICAPTFCLQAE